MWKKTLKELGHAVARVVLAWALKKLDKADVTKVTAQVEIKKNKKA